MAARTRRSGLLLLACGLLLGAGVMLGVLAGQPASASTDTAGTVPAGSDGGSVAGAGAPRPEVDQPDPGPSAPDPDRSELGELESADEPAPDQGPSTLGELKNADEPTPDPDQPTLGEPENADDQAVGQLAAMRDDDQGTATAAPPPTGPTGATGEQDGPAWVPPLGHARTEDASTALPPPATPPGSDGDPGPEGVRPEAEPPPPDPAPDWPGAELARWLEAIRPDGLVVPEQAAPAGAAAAPAPAEDLGLGALAGRAGRIWQLLRDLDGPPEPGSFGLPVPTLSSTASQLGKAVTVDLVLLAVESFVVAGFSASLAGPEAAVPGLGWGGLELVGAAAVGGLTLVNDQARLDEAVELDGGQAGAATAMMQGQLDGEWFGAVGGNLLGWGACGLVLGGSCGGVLGVGGAYLAGHLGAVHAKANWAADHPEAPGER